MKKVALAVAAVVAGSGALLNTASAEMYLGGKLGFSKFNNACYLDSPCDDDPIGASFHTGYNFNKTWALEYGVDYLGEYEGTFKDGNVVNGIDGDLWAMTLAPKFNYHLDDAWNVFAKLGGAYMISGDEKDIVPTGSLGVEYALSNALSVRTEYQRYQGMSDDIIDDMDANFFGIGVNYAFGATPPPPPPEPVVEEVMVVEEVVAEPVIVTKSHEAVFGSGTFALNSTEIDPENKEKADELAMMLKEYPQAQAEIVGYTDSSGAADYNQTLSEKRAQAVADYLVSQGVNPEQLTVKGMGEENPVASNATKEGRHENRRVEVKVPEFEYKVTE